MTTINRLFLAMGSERRANPIRHLDAQSTQFVSPDAQDEKGKMEQARCLLHGALCVGQHEGEVEKRVWQVGTVVQTHRDAVVAQPDRTTKPTQAGPQSAGEEKIEEKNCE